MGDLPLDFVGFAVIDVHVVAGATSRVPDRWAVDGLKLEDQVLVVSGRLSLTQKIRKYRIGGIAIFRSSGAPVDALDQQQLAGFVNGPASHLLYSHLRSHLNTLAGIVDSAERFPVTAPIPAELLRSSEGQWHIRSLEGASGEAVM